MTIKPIDINKVQNVHFVSIGNIMIFSPAFAPFAHYKNEYERNDAFLAALNLDQD
jgi:UDP-N-acetylmuramoylalanine-D-glutamate ligase